MEKEEITGLVSDFIALMIKLGIDATHPEYNGLVSLVSGITDMADRASLRSTIIEIRKRVDALESSHVTHEYLDSPYFVDAIKQLLYISDREDLNQKKNLYANFFESCCLRASIPQLNIQRYFRLLRDLDSFELQILSELPIYYVAKCNKDSLYHKLIEQSAEITREDVAMGLDSLISKGLAIQIDDDDIAKHPNRFGAIHARGERLYYKRTSLGKGLLSFINFKSDSVN